MPYECVAVFVKTWAGWRKRKFSPACAKNCCLFFHCRGCLMTFPSPVPGMTVACLSPLHITLITPPVFSVSCKTEVFLQLPARLFFLYKLIKITKEIYLWMHSRLALLLYAPSQPIVPPPPRPSQSTLFIQLDRLWWFFLFFFFPPAMFILYMSTCTEDLKLFIFTGVTLLRCISLSLSLFLTKDWVFKIFSGICKRNLRV